MSGDDIRELALPLRDAGDLGPLLDRRDDARVVAVGEASHGTHEYYAWRAALTAGWSRPAPRCRRCWPSSRPTSPTPASGTR